ncbi:MAG TPA: RnfABCDGE type electron transport complex subunit B [Candidatus Anaerofilum excrementigallinarum]|nr:RnfABCDGE type electron transport complex subunit B [Candidatus Anaerofilum excrementigallinarum]
MSIAIAVALVTVLGLIGAGILVLAAKFMHVEEDPRVGQVQACLPGANCGACGYAGCADYAKAIVEGAPVNKCVPGGAAAAQGAAAVMGVDAGATAIVNAVVGCQGANEICKRQYEYEGVSSCRAAHALFAGPYACPYGCLGFGDCEAVCQFDAIHVTNGLAKVDTAKCTGCGMCKDACPQKIIWMHSSKDKPVVLCANHEKGAITNKECSLGCIGCMKCEKNCPEQAIKVNNFVARIDYDKCTGCGTCVEVCPKHVIHKPADF